LAFGEKWSLMKLSPPRPRTPSGLSDSVQRQLNMYALAASAAGVGMLALAQPADAKVIYTPAHHYVLLHHPLGLDLNHDGVVDFWIRRDRFFDTATAYATEVFAVGALRPNRVAGMAGIGSTTSGRTFYVGTAYALRAGRQIGSKLHFASREPITNLMGIRNGVGSRYYCSGPWNNLRHRYLGLKFEIRGKIHYGWARLNESCDLEGGRGKGAEALLTGYAYEAVADKPIIAGQTEGPDVITVQPASLGRLAQGPAKRSEK